MPTYQYACKSPDCGSEFERVQAFADPAVTECPACGGPVRKVFGAVGVVFKGSGFYRTDSRASSANGSEKTSGTGSAEKKTDSATKSPDKAPSASGSGSGSTGKAAASA